VCKIYSDFSAPGRCQYGAHNISFSRLIIYLLHDDDVTFTFRRYLDGTRFVRGWRGYQEANQVKGPNQAAFVKGPNQEANQVKGPNQAANQEANQAAFVKGPNQGANQEANQAAFVKGPNQAANQEANQEARASLGPLRCFEYYYVLNRIYWRGDSVFSDRRFLLWKRCRLDSFIW
jgi:hypothetical protein